MSTPTAPLGHATFTQLRSEAEEVIKALAQPDNATQRRSLLNQLRRLIQQMEMLDLRESRMWQEPGLDMHR
jgi:hypothetical protein